MLKSDAVSLMRSRWLSLLLGAACVAVGVVPTTRPFTSLSLLVVLVSVGPPRASDAFDEFASSPR